MFCRAAQTIKETKRPLPVLPELPIHQDHEGDKEDTAKKPRHWSRFGKFRVGTRKTQGAYHMDNTTKTSRGTVLIPRKTNPYELRDQELNTEGDKRAKGKFLNWKMRQQQKLGKSTKVPNASDFLRRKFPKVTRHKKKQTNTQEQSTIYKVMKRSVETTCIFEMEEFRIFFPT